MCKDLLDEGAQLRIYDPKATESQVLPGLQSSLFCYLTVKQAAAPISMDLQKCAISTECVMREVHNKG